MERKYEDLKNKLNEFILMLEACEREAYEKMMRMEDALANKDSILAQTEKANEKLKEIQIKIDGFDITYKDILDETERIRNQYITKNQYLDVKLKEQDEGLEKLKKEILFYQETKDNYDRRLQEVNKRSDDAIAMEKDVQEKLDNLKEKIDDLNIDGREIALSKGINNLNSLDEEIKNKNIELKNTQDSLDARQSILDDKNEELSATVISNNELKDSLDKKEKELESVSNDLDVRKQQLDYKELQINKIIKEKNIADQFPK